YIVLILLSSSHGSHDPRHPHSFPTRRSSDLLTPRTAAISLFDLPCTISCRISSSRVVNSRDGGAALGKSPSRGSSTCSPAATRRSEEHTSELQSRVDLVCRLLLEKKK